MENKSGIVSYFGFEKYDTGAEARNAFQFKGSEFGADINGSGSWSDGRLRSQFDTLQVFENGKPQVRVPYWGGDKMGPVLEPFAEAYPQYGSGMSLQLHANSQKLDICL
ncbi:hypothetical protein ACCW92_04825 [Enterobacter soli]|uniref:hypothetical protein n=1 Tax=Enterobacter soli TaxID=885040 RepID=UPI003ED86D58